MSKVVQVVTAILIVINDQFVRLWLLRRDEPLVHVSLDILLTTKHILDHDNIIIMIIL